MKKGKHPKNEAAELRRRAEEQLEIQAPEAGFPRADEEAQRLLHELQVHQIELEMQNAELREARDEVEKALESYTDLYDFAPVGYLTLDREGTIRAANLTAAGLLVIERSRLIGRHFEQFVANEARDAFTSFLRNVFESRAKDTCEAVLPREGNPIFVQVEAVAAMSGQECRVALIDITERKRMEERAAHLASFPQLNPNPILEVDYSGRITFFNPATVNILKTLGMDETDIAVFLPPDMEGIVKNWDGLNVATLYREIAIKDRFFGETIFLTPQFKGVRIYTFDITEHKKDEEALRRSEALYRTIGESIDYGIWICAPDGRNIYASDSFLHLVGMTQEQCSNFGWGEVLHPDDAERTIAAWKECVRVGGTWDIEHRFRGVDGQWHPILARGMPVRDDQGTITGWAGINLDISRIKEAENKLRMREHQLAEAQRLVHLGSWQWDSVADKVTGSDEFYRIFGRDFSSYEGFLELVHPDDRDRVNKAVHDTLDRQKLYNIFYRIVQPDETIRIIHAQGQATIDDAGTVVRMIGTAQDVTERKQLEEKLEIVNTDLAARATELEAANIELEAFNYTVSHDLRKPLTVINSYCQVVQEMCSSRLDDECKRYLREMYEGTLRMNRLIDTLLDFARITRVEMHHGKADLSRIAQEVALGLKVSAPKRRVTFRIAEGITTDGDAGLLRVVLDNLMGNAWKFTGNQEETVIEFGVTEVDGKPAFFVRDNGPGFDMAFAAKLFIPFQRLPGTDVEGHGIGLATVERIVRRHGGRVWAEGVPGMGATFTFTLE